MEYGVNWFRTPPSPAAARPVLYASLLLAILIAPEIGRMIDFHSFETFDPHGPGLGNLFGQISPFEALGIWPSGDFRLSPGDGAVPPLGYYLGAAFASILLLYGLVLSWRRRETALIAGLAAAALAYAAARIGGTPYTAAKAIEIGAPWSYSPSSCPCCAAPSPGSTCSPRAAARCSPSPTRRSARRPTRRP